MSAARVWWNFRVMGHDEVYVLDGGLPRWLAEGRLVQSGSPAKAEPRTFTARFRPRLVRAMNEVTQALAGRDQVLDARPAGRFSGAEPEPRAGLPSGHMPGALNLPYGALIADGALLPPDQLQARFSASGADPDRPIIATCGSGVTAAVIALALARLGHWDTPVYDGAWAEWAAQPKAEIAVG
jgi:thiosulfate/3-mercaptopyruvate sulfurtransferase